MICELRFRGLGNTIKYVVRFETSQALRVRKVVAGNAFRS